RVAFTSSLTVALEEAKSQQGDPADVRARPGSDAPEDATSMRAQDPAILGAIQQAIFDNASYVIMTTDLAGKIQLFNRAAERLLGYQRDEVLHRETPLLFHSDAEIEIRMDELAEDAGATFRGPIDALTLPALRARPTESEEREWTYITKAGQRHTIMLSVTAL